MNPSLESLPLPLVAVIVVAMAVSSLLTRWLTLRRFAMDRAEHFSERLRRASQDLGSDKLEVRLGAIAALDRIAEDSSRDRPRAIELLETYVRERSPRNGAPLRAPGDIEAAVWAIVRRRRDGGRDTGVDLRGVSLCATKLAGLDFRGGDLSGSEFGTETVQVSAADFRDANLGGADLRRSRLPWVSFWRADLSGAELAEADLRNAFLVGADLRSANLTNADLRNAHLENANITGANLSGANLAGATGITRAQLRSALLDHGTVVSIGITATDPEIYEALKARASERHWWSRLVAGQRRRARA
jgi:hypothetical protein